MNRDRRGTGNAVRGVARVADVLDEVVVGVVVVVDKSRARHSKWGSRGGRVCSEATEVQSCFLFAMFRIDRAFLELRESMDCCDAGQGGQPRLYTRTRTRARAGAGAGRRGLLPDGGKPMSARQPWLS